MLSSSVVGSYDDVVEHGMTGRKSTLCWGCEEHYGEHLENKQTKY